MNSRIREPLSFFSDIRAREIKVEGLDLNAISIGEVQIVENRMINPATP